MSDLFKNHIVCFLMRRHKWSWGLQTIVKLHHFLFTAACETLQNLAGGSVTLTTDSTTTEAIFSCETGYTMTGSPVLACRSDGTWNMSQPLCSKFSSSIIQHELHLKEVLLP